MSKGTCVRNDDESMVSDHFCGGERPRDETVVCNTHECPARWVLNIPKAYMLLILRILYVFICIGPKEVHRKNVVEATYYGGYF